MRLFRTDTSNASALKLPALREAGSVKPVVAVTLATIATLAAAVAGAQLNQTLQAQIEVDRAAAQAQQQIDSVRDRTLDAAARYAQAMTEAESYEKYNKQLSAQVASSVRVGRRV